MCMCIPAVAFYMLCLTKACAAPVHNIFTIQLLQPPLPIFDIIHNDVLSIFKYGIVGVIKLIRILV